MTEKVRFQINVLAIQNYVNSGSVFLQSVIDSHPNTLSMPGLAMHDYYLFWTLHKQKPLEQMLAIFANDNPYLFLDRPADFPLNLDKLGPDRNMRSGVSFQKFREIAERLCRTNGTSRKSLFIAIYFAYAQALGRQVPTNVYLVWPVHGRPRAGIDDFLLDFPKTRFLHIVRNPGELFASGIKHITTARHEIANPVEGVLTQLFLNRDWHDQENVCGDRPYGEELRPRSRAVRLEDLHRAPEATTAAICRWLDIAWSPTMLESTFDGKLWWNRPESPQISGFDPKRAGAWNPTYANGLDRLRILMAAAPKADAWGYKMPRWLGTALAEKLFGVLALLPFKAELFTPLPLQRIIRRFAALTEAVPGERQNDVDNYICERLLAPYWRRNREAEARGAAAHFLPGRNPEGALFFIFRSADGGHAYLPVADLHGMPIADVPIPLGNKLAIVPRSGLSAPISRATRLRLWGWYQISRALEWLASYRRIRALLREGFARARAEAGTEIELLPLEAPSDRKALRGADPTAVSP